MLLIAPIPQTLCPFFAFRALTRVVICSTLSLVFGYVNADVAAHNDYTENGQRRRP